MIKNYRGRFPSSAGLNGMPSRAVTDTYRKGSEMPKMKTKSSAKKRFKLTASGRVKVAQAGKRHGMIKRSNKFIRNARGMAMMSKQDEKIAKSVMPYGR